MLCEQTAAIITNRLNQSTSTFKQITKMRNNNQPYLIISFIFNRQRNSTNALFLWVNYVTYFYTLEDVLMCHVTEKTSILLATNDRAIYLRIHQMWRKKICFANQIILRFVNVWIFRSKLRLINVQGPLIVLFNL